MMLEISGLECQVSTKSLFYRFGTYSKIRQHEVEV